MMCGITGWVNFKKDLRLQQNVLHTMTKTLKNVAQMRKTFGLKHMQHLDIKDSSSSIQVVASNQ